LYLNLLRRHKYRNMNNYKILIATDGSPASADAVNEGLRLADHLNAEVGLIYVINTKAMAGVGTADIGPQQALDEFREDGKHLLRDLAQTAGRSIALFQPEGEPAEEILKAADEWRANMIVVGTHGRTGVMHLLMGSVAEELLKRSNLPLLVVPSLH
jgi:nucleotide-binding universal stress UspA family protein